MLTFMNFLLFFLSSKFLDFSSTFLGCKFRIFMGWKADYAADGFFYFLKDGEKGSGNLSSSSHEDLEADLINYFSWV